MPRRREATWKAGVDVLSFGATKGGALAAEAVVFFDPARGADMAERRKRGGHLLSKHRFLAAQFEAYLADDLWLELARHANAMADRLAAGLTAAGLAPVWPVEANEVFVALPRAIDARLKAAGANYYPWPTDALPAVQIGRRRDAGAPGHVVRHHGRTMSIASWPRARILMPRRRPSCAPIAGYGQRVADKCRRAAKPSTRCNSRSGVELRVDTQRRSNHNRGVVLATEDRALRGSLALAVMASVTGLAQPVPPPQAGSSIPAMRRMPPHEILTIVRSTGMEPVSRPIRQGPAYVLRALDPAGEEVRVIVDARRRIVEVATVMMPRYAVMPPPYGRPPRPIPMVPDGYGPNARIAGPPPSPDAAPSGLGRAARPGRLTLLPPACANPAAQAGPPPLPRPRPKVAATEAPAAQPPAPGTALDRAGEGQQRERQHRRDPGAGRAHRNARVSASGGA